MRYIVNVTFGLSDSASTKGAYPKTTIRDFVWRALIAASLQNSLPAGVRLDYTVVSEEVKLEDSL